MFLNAQIFKWSVIQVVSAPFFVFSPLNRYPMAKFFVLMCKNSPRESVNLVELRKMTLKWWRLELILGKAHSKHACLFWLRVMCSQVCKMSAHIWVGHLQHTAHAKKHTIGEKIHHSTSAQDTNLFSLVKTSICFLQLGKKHWKTLHFENFWRDSQQLQKMEKSRQWPKNSQRLWELCQEAIENFSKESQCNFVHCFSCIAHFHGCCE